MGNKKRVLLGMSGGVDSSVSAILLQRQGYEVMGATMLLWEEECSANCGSRSAVEDAKAVCDQLGIEHHVLDFRKEFQHYVIDNFIDTYQKVRTPNPCIECNKYMKFDLMYQKAKELGCEYIATGHYARTAYDETYGRYVLKKSKAKGKDQTYVMYHMPKELVEKVLFPLSDFESKEEIRAIAKEAGLTIASKPESQEICFIPDNDYISFLDKHMTKKMEKGKVIDTKGMVLGDHQGLYRYTIGQRRGLGISSTHPLYVVKLDEKQNVVIVGEEKDIFSTELEVMDVHYLLMDQVEHPLEITAKIRYSAKEVEATLIPLENKEASVIFHQPVRAVTPGQSVVFYIGDCVLGGGKIK